MIDVDVVDVVDIVADDPLDFFIRTSARRAPGTPAR
jgi:hypothetical protein